MIPCATGSTRAYFSLQSELEAIVQLTLAPWTDAGHLITNVTSVRVSETGGDIAFLSVQSHLARRAAWVRFCSLLFPLPLWQNATTRRSRRFSRWFRSITNRACFTMAVRKRRQVHHSRNTRSFLQISDHKWDGRGRDGIRESQAI